MVSHWFLLTLFYHFYRQTARPRTVIPLWKVHIEEPKFSQVDPAVIIVDKATSMFLHCCEICSMRIMT